MAVGEGTEARGCRGPTLHARRWGFGGVRHVAPLRWLVSNFLVRLASSSGASGRPGTPLDHAGESTLLSRSGGEKGLR